MRFLFRNKRIAGIITVLPTKELVFEDEMHHFDASTKSSLKLKAMMGLGKHRIAESHVTAADLCVYGLRHLFAKRLLERDDIDAVIFVSQTPDHFIPPTSNVIHGKLGLKQEAQCLDINHGCAGFIVGLQVACSLLEQDSVEKVVLLNGDTPSKQTNVRDRATYPLIGDAASVTLVERTNEDIVLYGNLKNDGTRSDALVIPAGAYRLPASAETREIVGMADGNWRCKEHIHMDGTAIFDFTMKDVPPMIEDVLRFSRLTKDDIDLYLFHQPNRFILQRLAARMKISEERMPNNIVENFGNASSATIPTNVCFNIGKRALKETFTVCFAGFGVGLTWGAIVTRLGRLGFCDLIDYPE
jgi:3-oxoacyl-[acyl-carrier-protein] synthase-3